MIVVMFSRYASLTLIALAIPAFALTDPVKTESGLVSGAPGTNPAVRVYKGIPYAAPPTGELRWKPPRPAAHWEGTRQATTFSKVCMQLPYPPESIYYRPSQPMSEDCLALNIWTAAASANERRPVMMWIHGGALTRGFGSTPTYDGEALAARGVVVVTINYRLNVFGFLAHPGLTAESDVHSSGNYGILDQIAALDWIRNNIAAFGGDPKRVTIFGESAGSWSVNCLMATPLARGKFQRAIGESGGSFQPMQSLHDAEQEGVRLASRAGAQTVAELRSKPAEDLVKASAGFATRPSVDGWMLPQDIYTIFAAGHQNDVPLIAGSNADEATTLSPWPSTGTPEAFAAQIRTRVGAMADRFLQLYPAATAEQARDAHYASYRDFAFGWEMRTWARLQAKTGKAKAYLYYFSHVPPGPRSATIRAYHASEIAYVFNTLSTRAASSDADQRLADMMSGYWANFAITGNPNAKELPPWPAYKESQDLALEFGDQVKPIAHLHKPALDAIDDFYMAQRSKR